MLRPLAAALLFAAAPAHADKAQCEEILDTAIAETHDSVIVELAKLAVWIERAYDDAEKAAPVAAHSRALAEIAQTELRLIYSKVQSHCASLD